ncbi:hypothetical protein OUZ56_027646 [Daphnia magna]|uniref:Uncharacterized protein n=1 Tax=Daphnia magna TaxID=35525 RepID=A0ABR0B1I2_9CRUS|nr:hypothetical protein OUZ56_027646 [Daphnia magna]
MRLFKVSEHFERAVASRTHRAVPPSTSSFARRSNCSQQEGSELTTTTTGQDACFIHGDRGADSTGRPAHGHRNYKKPKRNKKVKASGTTKCGGSRARVQMAH